MFNIHRQVRTLFLIDLDMIPDKIYIGTVTLSSNAPSEEHLLPDWHLRPNPKIANVEYIRKDALLEWAKFVLKCQEEELAKYDGPSYMRASIMGRIDAYKVLIAKLNSL